uniref:Potassium channel toxin alpha-KTx 12.6 n=1 Tax=Lychas mucronatus TaxID=172552 RepID=KA126_LYCMC|nr:RecName: Full=Potassium channel toxin alpha-KTx 12.6; Flags: Precursor [Lychas mucronatus]
MKMKIFIITIVIALFITSIVEAQNKLDVKCVRLETCREPCKKQLCLLPMKCMNGKCVCSPSRKIC